MLNEDLEKKCFKLEELGKTETPIECYFSVPPEEQISKILSISSCVEIENMEVLSSQVNYNGKIILNLIYINQNGEVNNGKSLCTFSLKYENSKIEANENIDIESKVIDVKVDKINPDSVKMFVIVQNTFSQINNKKLNLFDKNGNYHTKNKDLKHTFKKYFGSETYTENLVFETKDRIKKILNTEAQVVPTQVECANDFIVVNGEITCTTIYITDEEEPRIISTRQNLPFREEIEVLGVNKDNFAILKMFVKNEMLTCELEEMQESSNIKVQVPVKVYYEIFESKETNVVCDLYSTTHNLNIKTEKVILSTFEDSMFFESKIEGNITLDQEQPRIDKLLGVDAQYITQANSYLENGYLILEGVAYATLIYLSDEENALNSVQIEIPYSVKQKVDKENVGVKVLSFLADSDITVRRGREIMYDGKLKTLALFYTETEEEIITEVEELEEVEKTSEALEILFAESGMTFWDIAKDRKVEEEILRSQNPEVKEPFEKKEKLVYFEKKEWK